MVPEIALEHETNTRFEDYWTIGPFSKSTIASACVPRVHSSPRDIRTLSPMICAWKSACGNSNFLAQGTRKFADETEILEKESRFLEFAHS